MPMWDWQVLIALLCVAGALYFLGRHTVRVLLRRAPLGCASWRCRRCPAQPNRQLMGDHTEPPDFVPLDSLQQPTGPRV